MTDTEILDWLSLQVVEVRRNLRYGSKHLFYATPVDEDGYPDSLSNLRQQVIQAIKGELS